MENIRSSVTHLLIVLGTSLEEIETKMMLDEAAAGKQNHARAIVEVTY
ncbi:MAG: hypothetical protein ACXWW0_09205 [Bacteroidia bacterium]